MHRVKNKQEYIDNWVCLRDAVYYTVVDTAVILAVFGLMLLLVVPDTIGTILGIAPGSREEDGQ